MAAKATIQDITDAGFKAEQFGTPDDWSTDVTGYLARLLTRAEVWSMGRFGTGYASVVEGTPTFEHLRQAELCWVSGQLWKNRTGFIDSNAASSREGLAYLDRREYLAAADRSFECANDQMALAIGGEGAVAGTGARLIGAETGPYAPAEVA